MSLTAQAASAFVIAFVAAGGLAVSGPVDRPRERGNHHTPTPTSGGLAFLLAVAPIAPAGPHPALGSAVLLAGLLGLVGAVDDLRDVGAKTKLALQALAAALFALLVARIEALPFPGFDMPLGPVIGAAGTVLWLLVLTNAVNFMDGSNGLAPGVQAIAFAAFLAVVPATDPLFAAALVGLAAILGFLPFNLAGRLFQGDVGALFAAFLIGALAVLAANAGHASVWFAPTVLAPFLTDVILTVGARARRQERLFDAHREHLYQLWLAATGKPHLALAWRMWLLTGLCAGGAIASERADVPLAGFAAAYLVCGFGWLALRPRLRRGG